MALFKASIGLSISKCGGLKCLPLFVDVGSFHWGSNCLPLFVGIGLCDWGSKCLPPFIGIGLFDWDLKCLPRFMDVGLFVVSITSLHISYPIVDVIPINSSHVIIKHLVINQLRWVLFTFFFSHQTINPLSFPKIVVRQGIISDARSCRQCNHLVVY